MTGTEDGSGGDDRPATEAFELLGDETRLEILRVLADHEPAGPSFSELRKAVGVRDAGRFNYHLDRLRGRFVEKTGDGYRLRYAGQMVVAAVLAGTYTDDAAPAATELDHACPDCGRSLRATYEDAILTIGCPDHGTRFRTALPPGAAEGRTAEELVELAAAKARRFVGLARRGACPLCWGRMDATLLTDDPDRDRPHAEFDCRRCWMTAEVSVGPLLATHPSVAAFLHEHGVDPDRAQWAVLDDFDDGADVEVTDADESEVVVTVRLDGDGLRAEVDGDASIVAVDPA